MRQSRLPSAADSPTTWDLDWVMTCRVPATAATTGEAYAGPSPFHCHFGDPVAGSSAVSAPDLFPPTCTINRSPSITGDIATPKSGEEASNSLADNLRHSTLPVTVSNADSVPLIPNVNSREPPTTGVDLGPLPWLSAAGLI